MKNSRNRESGRTKAAAESSSKASNTAQQSNNSIATSLLKYGQLPYSESGEIATDTSSSFINVSQDGSAINVSSATYNPGGTLVAVGNLSRLAGASLLNTAVSIAPCTSTAEQSSGDNTLSKVLGLLAGPRALLDGEKDSDKLKEHVRILQEENFTRIAQIADLQVEVNNLKSEVLELKEDNLKKAIHIAQLERERRSGHEMLPNEEIEEQDENPEQLIENPQETMEPEGLVESNEQTVVIEDSDQSAMERMDVIENTEAVQNTVYQQEVCDAPITVSVESGTALAEAHAASQTIQETLQDSDVIAVNAHAIIVSQAVVDEQLQ